MDQRTDIRDFLTSRRARITPQQAGIPDYGAKRRVPGLRREEVALLAGISVDYYTRLERGNLGGVSDSVLNSVATVLQLDEAERAHLFDLIKFDQGSRRTRRKNTATQIRPSIQQILDALMGVPAWVSNDRLDVVATNPLGAELYRDAVTGVRGRVNIARFLFLDQRARDFFVDWDQHADNAVAILRSAATRDPYDEQLTGLIGELSTRSDEFRVRWGAHNVRFHRSGPKALKHPEVGELDLTFDALELPADPGLTLYAMTAEPNSPTAERLKLLGSLAATRQLSG
jgi:transcriptional regulator with XRE-family HTH domain